MAIFRAVCRQAAQVAVSKGKMMNAEWSLRPLGALVLEQERRCIGEIATGLFGYQLLQVGSLGPDLDYLSDCPIRTRTLLLRPDDRAAPGDAHTEPERLPIKADSVDALIMPHTLDVADDPRQVLREAERVLIPEGRLVLLGFNPWSLWGIRRLLSPRPAPPWTGKFIGYPRLSDWLSLLGLAVERTEVLMFRPPVTHGAVLERFAFMDAYGARFWPMLAGVYVVVATKRVSTLTPIRLPWKRRTLIRTGIVQPSAREARRG
jgi:SAM-dependent methyltransferase